MGGELKEKVAQGVAWSMAEKIGSMLLAMAVRLVILRLLTRDILGFMSIPSAVVTVLLVIVDSGFSQSLVRHKGPSQSDYKSVFLFNIAVSDLAVKFKINSWMVICATYPIFICLNINFLFFIIDDQTICILFFEFIWVPTTISNVDCNITFFSITIDEINRFRLRVIR